nr:hypothetical protein [Halomonas sp.]
MRLEQVIQETKELSANDRALLDHWLISSLETQHDEGKGSMLLGSLLLNSGLMSLKLEMFKGCHGKRLKANLSLVMAELSFHPKFPASGVR